jgi:hypothetical protein
VHTDALLIGSRLSFVTLNRYYCFDKKVTIGSLISSGDHYLLATILLGIANLLY